eukprot:766503-Hanusia_phi.AAC.1
MPPPNKPQSDYSKGVIYTIKCRSDPSLVYVGSTTRPIHDRWLQHLNHCNNYKSKCFHLKLYQSMRKTNKDDWYIQEYEKFPCDNFQQLLDREGEVIRLIGTLNTNIPGRISKEHFEQIKEYRKTQTPQAAATSKHKQNDLIQEPFDDSLDNDITFSKSPQEIKQAVKQSVIAFGHPTRIATKTNTHTIESLCSKFGNQPQDFIDMYDFDLDSLTNDFYKKPLHLFKFNDILLINTDLRRYCYNILDSYFPSKKKHIIDYEFIVYDLILNIAFLYKHVKFNPDDKNLQVHTNDLFSKMREVNESYQLFDWYITCNEEHGVEVFQKFMIICLDFISPPSWRFKSKCRYETIRGMSFDCPDDQFDEELEDPDVAEIFRQLEEESKAKFSLLKI